MKADSQDATIAAPPRVRVVESLSERIRLGHLLPGDRIPTEVKLCETLSVSRPTVRAALAALEAEGLITRVSNRARIVSRSATRTPVGLAGSSVGIVSQFSSQIPGGSRGTGWWQCVHERTREALRTRRLHPLLIDADVLDERMVAELATERLFGLVLLRNVIQTPMALALAKRLKAVGVVVVSAEHEPSLEDADVVTSDHAEGAYRLTRWLIERGCRRILRFWMLVEGTPQQADWLQQRDAGYLRAMRDAGLEAPAPLELLWPWATASNRQRFDHMTCATLGAMTQRPGGIGDVDAIMAVSDAQVFPIAAACRLMNRQPGKDLHITGYDNYWADCLERQWEPYAPAATMDKQNAAIGEALVRTLLDRAEGRLPEDRQHRLIQPQIIICDEDTHDGQQGKGE